jgi:hypothetical protein
VSQTSRGKFECAAAGFSTAALRSEFSARIFRRILTPALSLENMETGRMPVLRFMGA